MMLFVILSICIYKNKGFIGEFNSEFRLDLATSGQVRRFKKKKRMYW